MEISGLDQIDNKIIELLRENARLSYSDLGKAVGLSRVAVKTRIKQLENNGVIRGYYAAINTGAIPKGIHFTLDIETEPRHFEEVLDRLAASPMIHKIFGTSGESGILALGFAPNSATLGSYAGHFLRSTKGVRKLNWRILVTTYKDTERGVEFEVQHQRHKHLEERS